jgi:GAF domain-containing protein
MTSIRMERQLLNRAEQREQVLAEAAEYLTSSWAPAEVLRQLPHLLVPGFSEWASVVLKTGPDSYVRVAAATSNEAMRQLTQERDLRLDPRTTAGIAAVIRTGHSELHATMPPEAILAAKDAGISTKGRTADFRSAVIAPLFVKGQVVGAVNASSSRAHAFSAQDLTFLERFAKLAGIAVQTGTLVEELRSRDEQLRVALDAAPIFLFSQDCDLRYTWVSDLGPAADWRTCWVRPMRSCSRPRTPPA